MKIIKNELKKILKSKAIIIASVIFLILNLFNIYRNYNIENGVPDYYSDALIAAQQQLDGELTQDKINFINSKVNLLSQQANGEYSEQKKPDEQFLTGYAFWDLNLWTTYQNYIQRAEEYSEALSLKLETAEQNIKFFRDSNKFYENANRLFYSTYSGRQISEIYDTDRLPEYFSYNLSSVLIIITLLLGIIPVFCSENECDMDTVLLTSKNGRRKTVNAKIIAALIFTFVITLLYSAFDFTGFMIFNRLDGLGQNIYAVQGYENCPLNIKVWQYILLQFVFKCVGMCLITLVFLLLSKLFKKSNLPFICGIAAFMIMTLCKVFFTNESGQKLNLFNPISFLTSYNVFSDYNILNIFGNPVFEWQVMIIAGVILIAALYAIIMVMSIKYEFMKRRSK